VAVELVVSSGRPVPEIARDLGINEATLGNWVNKAEQSGKVKDKPLETDEQARLEELEEEVRRLRMERDLLKKSSGVVCAGEPVKFAFIADMAKENERMPREEQFPVTFMCEMLSVSRSGYYACASPAPGGASRPAPRWPRRASWRRK
jgi:hypothetical protein